MRSETNKGQFYNLIVQEVLDKDTQEYILQDKNNISWIVNASKELFVGEVIDIEAEIGYKHNYSEELIITSANLYLNALSIRVHEDTFSEEYKDRKEFIMW